MGVLISPDLELIQNTMGHVPRPCYALYIGPRLEE